MGIESKDKIFLNFELSAKEGKARGNGFGCCIFAHNCKNHGGCRFLERLGFYGEPSRWVGEVDARVKVLGFRTDSGIGTGGRNTVDGNLVPDFILPKTSCCRYGGFDGFLNGRTVQFEDPEGRSIFFGGKFDVMVDSELYSSNKRLLDCRVDSVSDGEVVGVVRECCAISLNDNSTVAFGQSIRDCLLVCWRCRGRGRRCSARFLGPGKGSECCNWSGWEGSGGGWSSFFA